MLKSKLWMAQSPLFLLDILHCVVHELPFLLLKLVKSWYTCSCWCWNPDFPLINHIKSYENPALVIFHWCHPQFPSSSHRPPAAPSSLAALRPDGSGAWARLAGWARPRWSRRRGGWEPWPGKLWRDEGWLLGSLPFMIIGDDYPIIIPLLLGLPHYYRVYYYPINYILWGLPHCPIIIGDDRL